MSLHSSKTLDTWTNDVVRKLRFLANQKHTINPDQGELLSLLQCFPNLHTASLSWTILYSAPNVRPSLKPTTAPVEGLANLRRLQILLHPDWIGDARIGPDAHGMYELMDLFAHLPLTHVKEVGVFFEDFVNSEMTLVNSVLSTFNQVTSEMRFPTLHTFHLGFAFHIFGLPSGNLWVSTVCAVACNAPC